MGNFDSKSFNPQAFKYLVDRVPNVKTNEIKKSKALIGNQDIKDVFASQNGTEYAKVVMRGMLEGDAVNYDGKTDITASTTKTFERGIVVVGRAKAWVEKDFAYDVTGGVDFMDNVAEQVAEYKDGLDQDTILSVLKGVFSMTDTKGQEFVSKHTTDITAEDDGLMKPTTLNSATNKACGAGKKKFTLVFMHSDVATTLENLQLLEYLKYTDKEGFTRDLAIGTWNGKLVIVDDALPTEEVAAVEGNEEQGIVAQEAYTKYTTYVLGDGAIDYEDVGVKVPYEMGRNPAKNGGEDTLYMRQRKVFAPKGISYEKKQQATLSPTNAELENGKNWCLVHSGESTESQRSYINHKLIPIARIISRG
ncbi:MAG: phage coat protein [Lachnospiraceae bacterium]|nr:phage coat protein [Lachnospiraceae bacterium]